MIMMAADEDNSPPVPSEEKDNNDSSHEDKASRQHRLAKAQAEIDRILNNPVDPPFDFESEMKKVASISPPLIQEGSAEFQLEESVAEVEEQLYNAVKARDYDTAAKKSEEISQAHVDDCGLVLQANSAFYRAFSDKDVGEMERLWLKDRSCVCIHPSFKPLSGVRDIMSTWKRMFESSSGSFQRTWIDPCDIQLTVKATTAIITCVEDVYARRFIRGKRRKSELVNKLTATNIFRKVGGRWYMTYHHSSWHADSEAAKRALKTRKNSAGTRPPKRSGDTFGENLLNLRNSRKRDDDNDDDEDEDDDPTELGSILGLENFGPDLGDGSEGKQQGDGPQPTIISSNLDFLKDLGGLDGMLGMGSSDGDGMGLPPGSIIRISKINKNADEDINDGDELDEYDDEDDDDDDDDDDDEDEDDFDDDDNMGNEGGKSILKLLAEKRKEKKKTIADKHRAKSLRPKCIDALRQLAKDGRISSKQKRVLLTDIISCSARGEKSLVEHAYKLLCVDPTDEEAAEEDFVDQCQVFAQSFFEIDQRFN